MACRQQQSVHPVGSAKIDLIALLCYYFNIMAESPLALTTENPQVVLRQLTPADAPAYFEALDSSRDHLSQFGDTTGIKYPSVEYVTDSITNPSNPEKLRMGIWDGETFVGSINMTPDGDSAEIGYWLDGRHTGHGYATLAAKALASFAEKEYSTVYAEVVEGNEASANVLRRSGFTHIANEAGRLIFILDDVETSPSVVHIEKAERKDLQEVADLMEIVYADAYPNDRGITRDMFEGNKKFQRVLRIYLSQQMRNPNCNLLLARDEGGAIGTIGIRYDSENSKVAEIWGFYVDPERQNTGVGRELWQALMNQDGIKQLDKLHLTVAKDSKIAKEFYLREGFVVTDDEDWDWPHWTDERPHNQYWKMEKTLNQ